MKKSPKLFIPGPTHVSNDIMEVFSTEQIGHRTPEISQLIIFITKGIQKLLYTKNHTYLASHAATGLWEMGTKNSVEKGILHAVNGAFSSKWALSSEQLGYHVKRSDFQWGEGVGIDSIDAELSTSINNCTISFVYNICLNCILSILKYFFIASIHLNFTSSLFS